MAAGSCLGRDPEVAILHKPICSSRTELIIPGNMVQVKAHWSCTSKHGKSLSGEGRAHFPSFFSLAAARSSLSFRKSVTTARMDSRTAAANAASAKNSRGVGGLCYVTKRCLALTLHTSSYSWFTQDLVGNEPPLDLAICRARKWATLKTSLWCTPANQLTRVVLLVRRLHKEGQGLGLADDVARDDADRPELPHGALRKEREDGWVPCR